MNTCFECKACHPHSAAKFSCSCERLKTMYMHLSADFCKLAGAKSTDVCAKTACSVRLRQYVAQLQLSFRFYHMNYKRQLCQVAWGPWEWWRPNNLYEEPGTQANLLHRGLCQPMVFIA